MWDANREAYAGPADAFSTGTRFGFFDAFDAAYEAQARANSLYGLEAAFADTEAEQARAIRAAGLVPPRSLFEDVEGGRHAPYFKAAQFYSGDASEPSDIGSRLATRDAEIEELRKKNPSLQLRTYREMWGHVRERAQTAERRWGQSDNSVSGALGGFIGEMAASVDPRTDPFNFATLGVGGFGRTALGRIATEGLGQGAIETVNQLTGVQENRELLGLEHGFAEGAMAVGSAVAFGATIRGAAEGVGALGRRWFQNTPADPAPPVPDAPEPITDAEADALFVAAENHFNETMRDVYGPTRVGAGKTAADLEAVSEQLDAWDGPQPHQVTPDGAGQVDEDTARIVSGFMDTRGRGVQYHGTSTPLDQLYNLDEDGFAGSTMNIYGEGVYTTDAIDIAEGYSRKGRGGQPSVYRAAARDGVRLYDLDKAVPDDVAAKLRELAEHDDLIDLALDGDRPKSLRYVYDEMRDLSSGEGISAGEVQERFTSIRMAMQELGYGGYTHIGGRATGREPHRVEIYWDGKNDLSMTPDEFNAYRPLVERAEAARKGRFPKETPVQATTAGDVLPIINRSDVTEQMTAINDAADALAKANEIVAKETEANVEAFKSSVKTLLEPDEEGRVGVTLPDGTRLSPDDYVPGLDDDGPARTTVRGLIEKLEEDEQVFKAVGTCSTGKTSSTA